MSERDGGSAFPVPSGTYDPSPTDGMTMRDYFASAAMESLLYMCYASDMSLADAADKAYAIAGAMLTAREKQDAS